MFFVFNRGRNSVNIVASFVLVAALSVIPVVRPVAAFALREAQGQSDASNTQRLNVMRSKLEAMRRSLGSAIAALNAGDKGDKEKNADDPRVRLRGLDKETGSLLSEVNDLIGK